ncbi:hypothetical protein BGZ93_009150 [Podila epicladia]|nr:hypothetical protein BGZ92_010860 [Podila epicladia]KAG0090758.1 hypothetical protein BGZ93_009150 [Podila epicladia]
MSEETAKFKASVQFPAEVSASGKYGPITGSTSFKQNEVAAITTCIYAQRLCKKVHVKTEEFLANGYCEIVTTNARDQPVAAKHKTYTSGYAKSTTELRGL